MFYSQCWKCGERWELGTASTCKCPEETTIEWTEEKLPSPVLTLDTKPNYNMTFHRDGKQIGELDFNGPEMTFTGDADESAKLFFDLIARSFKERLEQERADERNSWPAEMEAMERQVNILTDALAQASKDAARYQVLRTWDLGGYDYGLYSPEEVDKAIDDCIKEQP